MSPHVDDVGLPTVLMLGSLTITRTYNDHGEVLTETTTDGATLLFSRS